MLNGMIEEMKKEGHQIPDDLEVKHSTKQRLIQLGIPVPGSSTAGDSFDGMSFGSTDSPLGKLRTDLQDFPDDALESSEEEDDQAAFKGIMLSANPARQYHDRSKNEQRDFLREEIKDEKRYKLIKGRHALISDAAKQAEVYQKDFRKRFNTQFPQNKIPLGRAPK